MKSDLPLLSVVMCTYNGARYVAAQLDSIRTQTYSNIEVVVCDDGSVDETPAIIAAYQQKDSRIRFFQNEKNLGFNKNFETAIGYARGEWMAIADQDDIWLPHKLEALYGLASPGTLLIHSYNAEFKNDDPAQTFFNPSRIRFEGSNPRQLFFYNTVSGHTILLNKRLLQTALPFPAGVYYDWWLGVQAAVKSEVRLHPEALVLHRQHESNSSHINKAITAEESKAAFFQQRINTLQQFLQIEALADDDKKLLRHFIHLLEKEWHKSFSFPVFLFFLRHAKSAFYYRRKKPMFFYQFKYSLKRAGMKVKNWT